MNPDYHIFQKKLRLSLFWKSVFEAYCTQSTPLKQMLSNGISFVPSDNVISKNQHSNLHLPLSAIPVYNLSRNTWLNIQAASLRYIRILLTQRATYRYLKQNYSKMPTNRTLRRTWTTVAKLSENAI